MPTAELPFEEGHFEQLMALFSGQKTLVVAPHGTVNAGVVTGGQRQVLTPEPEDGAPPAPMRQGPVRVDRLARARRCFVPPPGFEEAFAASESRIVFLVGEAGTGRETCALNLLAHGRRDPVIVQVDGTVNLTRWTPRPQDVDGYLVMEPADPFALRAWDLSRLEALLAEAGARLVIVTAEESGPAGTLEDHFGTSVLRHSPPDPRKVFDAHFADGCPDATARARRLRALEPGVLDGLLPEGLPPRRAVQVADALRSLDAEGGPVPGEPARRLARAEGTAIMARAQGDPALLSLLLALTVYGGSHHTVVTERAEELLRLMGPGGTRATGSHGGDGEEPRPGSPADGLRSLGARSVRSAQDGAAGAVDFFWPAVGEVVWERVCRDRADLVPVVHTWLTDPGSAPERIERAGRALAAMAEATGGRSLELLPVLASASPFPAPRVAARCLATAFLSPSAARAADALLDQWSVTSESGPRRAAAYACGVSGGLTDDRALRTLERLMKTSGGGEDDSLVSEAAGDALVRRFGTGDHTTRSVLLRGMDDWVRDGTAGPLIARTFPVLARTGFAWWSKHVLARAEPTAITVRLVVHCLNEPLTFEAMRDALLTWCAGADGAKGRSRALTRFLDGLVATREPGVLRWFLAVERCPDTMPGKTHVTRALVTWRDNTPTLPDRSTQRRPMPFAPRTGIFTDVARWYADSDPAPAPAPPLRLPDGPGAAGGALALAEARTLLYDRAAPPPARASLWHQVAERTRVEGPEWPTAVVWLGVPGLSRTARKVSWNFRADREDVEAELVACYLEALAGLDAHAADPGRAVLRAACSRTWNVWRDTHRENAVEDVERAGGPLSALSEEDVWQADYDPVPRPSGLSAPLRISVPAQRVEGVRLGALAQAWGVAGTATSVGHSGRGRQVATLSLRRTRGRG
ncbi:hypothetical protein ACWD4X_04365 [Streptomyces termitum]